MREVKLLIRIALDVMGGDFAPAEVIQGGLQALTEKEDLQMLLVGQEEVLADYLSKVSFPRERVETIHAPDVITCDEAPVLAVRRKKNSSMIKALHLVKEGKADAVVSAGNTGALMAGSLLVVGRMEGIERPAFPIVIPTFNGGHCTLLDVGANMDAKAENLVQYAIMGRIYAREIMGSTLPRVALLNVGVEENKGNEQTRQAFEQLKGFLEGFAGNVEARDVFFGAADVVVCDGFVGNILLKTVEGFSAGVFGYLREALSSNLRSKLGAALILPQMRKLKDRLDYAEYGGAPLLGVNGVCVKSHGSSKARAIRSSIINQAYRLAEQGVNEQIRVQLAGLTTL
jgi:glycerol-3-phosphate acyltransferase PlsX